MRVLLVERLVKPRTLIRRIDCLEDVGADMKERLRTWVHTTVRELAD